MSRTIIAETFSAVFALTTLALIALYYAAIGVIVFGLGLLILAELGILML